MSPFCFARARALGGSVARRADEEGCRSCASGPADGVKRDRGRAGDTTPPRPPSRQAEKKRALSRVTVPFSARHLAADPDRCRPARAARSARNALTSALAQRPRVDTSTKSGGRRGGRNAARGGRGSSVAAPSSPEKTKLTRTALDLGQAEKEGRGPFAGVMRRVRAVLLGSCLFARAVCKQGAGEERSGPAPAAGFVPPRSARRRRAVPSLSLASLPPAPGTPREKKRAR